MEHGKYTLELATEGSKFLDIISDISPDKRPIAAMMAESFINGMKAQEQLTKARPSA